MSCSKTPCTCKIVVMVPTNLLSDFKCEHQKLTGKDLPTVWSFSLVGSPLSTQRTELTILSLTYLDLQSIHPAVLCLDWVPSLISSFGFHLQLHQQTCD